jgi:hypothetical protein
VVVSRLWPVLPNPNVDRVVVPNFPEPLADVKVFRVVQDRALGQPSPHHPLPKRGAFLLVCCDCGGWTCGLRGGKTRKAGNVAYRCSKPITSGAYRLNIVQEKISVEATRAALKGRFVNADFLARLRAEAKANIPLLDADLIPAVVADVRSRGPPRPKPSPSGPSRRPTAGPCRSSPAASTR